MSDPYDVDDDLDDFGEDDTEDFECAAYWTGDGWHCPLAGTEECDWKCTETFDEDGQDTDEPLADGPTGQDEAVMQFREGDSRSEGMT